MCATLFIKVLVFRILSLECENSRHNERVKNFVKKYSIAKGNVSGTIIIVDTKTWYIYLLVAGEHIRS